MLFVDKLKLLKAIPMLHRLPDRQLTTLGGFLRPRELKHGEVLFQEGSMGMSLYFVSRGQIRISMHVAGDEHQDLAFFNPGILFGEAALIDKSTRSASASAVGDTLLFELFRGDLDRWAKQNPQHAVQFFAELVHVQSTRLRRTSTELTLHSVLANLMLDDSESEQEFMAKVIDGILPHLEDGWSAAAQLDGQALVSQGGFDFTPVAEQLGETVAKGGAWYDDSTYHVTLLGGGDVLGRLIFHAPAVLQKEDQDEIGRTLSGASRMVSIALRARRP
ncbi:MAG: cyclic nucleotide-binding domain-containing protein [Elusimicrobiota bacterium]